jgi:adenylyltransferase/sulfurtransferase
LCSDSGAIPDQAYTIMNIAEITPAEFLQRRAHGDSLTLLDVREDWEMSVASVQGVVHIPMAQVQARLSELDKNTEIVVLCRSGRRSLEIARMLQSNGYAALNLAGGILAWSRDIDPSIPTY